MRRVATVILSAIAVAACSTAEPVEQADVTAALDAVSAWLAADDDGVATDEAEARAAEVVEQAAPIVEARPDVEGLDDEQTAAFHDALADLRDSVAAQRDVLADCDDPDPTTCIARSDLHPADVQAPVEAFQEAIAPLVARAPSASAA